MPSQKRHVADSVSDGDKVGNRKISSVYLGEACKKIQKKYVNTLSRNQRDDRCVKPLVNHSNLLAELRARQRRARAEHHT